jgi:bifunctional non-homologous end joining protein LigD
MSLREYRRKRDFKRTAEPKPRVARNGAGHRFVIQKHAASRLHYDFRLEMGGTLKSWAVPKGVPFAKGEKRLAMQVEDHPVGYIDFEGVIPKGQYGGGTVMVWDTGTFEVLGKPELAKGKLHFQLHGKKLEGEWYLVQMHGGKEWLLIRGGEDMKPVSKKQDDTSALSQKSMAQLARSDQVWNSDKPKAPTAVKRARAKPALPNFIEPMKARLVAAIPKEEGWIFELKFDGFRALAFKRGEAVHLLSRNEKDFAGKFPEVVDAVAALKSSDCILDGEIVALDSKGRSSFQQLQAFEMGQKRPALFYYVFDLLRFEGRDLRPLRLEERKARLQELLQDPPPGIRFSASLPGTPEQLLKKTRQLGLEGLIGKRADSIYASGARNGAWIKLKLHNEQEMVIGGYTEPEGSRKHFGALLIGYRERGRLLFAGKVGTGFNTALLQSLHERFARIAQPDCPFANLPEKRTARYGQAITATQMKRCHWLNPVLVCQVRFAEWTRDGKLRQPVFLGLREDKEAREVTREKAK